MLFELVWWIEAVCVVAQSYYSICRFHCSIKDQFEKEQTKSKLEVMYKRFNRQLVKKGGNQKKVSRYMMYLDTWWSLCWIHTRCFFFWSHTSWLFIHDVVILDFHHRVIKNIGCGCTSLMELFWIKRKMLILQYNDRDTLCRKLGAWIHLLLK